MTELKSNKPPAFLSFFDAVKRVDFLPKISRNWLGEGKSSMPVTNISGLPEALADFCCNEIKVRMAKTQSSPSVNKIKAGLQVGRSVKGGV